MFLSIWHEVIFGEWDTVDTLLWKIYQYLKTKDIKYIKNIFTCQKEELINDFLQWINDFNTHTWDKFIEVHKLESFISKENDNRPISLKTGKAIKNNIGEEYDAMPMKYEECLKFFETANKKIIERTEILYNDILEK